MADNIDDDTLDNPIIPQSEDFKDEIISPNDTDIITANQETENMEVHKHPHHVTHKKKWGEYLLEFFMLFLAVFLGFVAENIRENSVERHREKEYIKSLASDLNSDIKIVESGIGYNIAMVKGKDSLVQLINRGITTSSQVDTFYALHKAYVGINRQYPFSKATLIQLLNAGNLRLIQNKDVADSIALYASRIDYFEKQLLPQFNYYDEKTLDASERLIDTKYFLTSVETGNYLPTTNNVLANNDIILLKAFAFQLEISKEANQITRTSLKNISIRAERLLATLKRAYDLD